MTLARHSAGLGAGAVESSAASRAATATSYGILFAASGSHMLNDMMQSLAPALYPVFRQEYALTFFQTGAITLTFQLTASLLQRVKVETSPIAKVEAEPLMEGRQMVMVLAPK